MVELRDATSEDAEAVAGLWARYLQEHYGLRDKVTAQVLRRDAFGETPRFRLLLAVGRDGLPWGAAAWGPCYDLHHFMPGVEVYDLYVAPEHRGIGVAASLLVGVAAAGAEHGAQFIRGMASLTSTPGRRLYDRVSVFFDGAAAYVSGRAFRHLAGLAGASAREICRSLPQREWNYEP